MGHIRLGTIPKSRSWTAVVASLGGPARLSTVEETLAPDVVVPEVARKALTAARAGITKAKKDEGVGYTFYLLAQVALASRDETWLAKLRDLGLSLSPESSIIDLTTEFQKVVDDFLRKTRSTSDVGEMAQRAAGDALTTLAGPRAETLFGSSGEDLRLALRSLSTKKGFGELGQAFFGRLMSRFLNFYLSRLTAAGIGVGSLQQIGDISTFNRTLEFHCIESARIVRDFAAEWYSKTEFQQGIAPANTAAFVAVALQKLAEELKHQETAK
jgi:hypothetical protein